MRTGWASAHRLCRLCDEPACEVGGLAYGHAVLLGDDGPIFAQIPDQLADQIAAGQLGEGARGAVHQ